jgi:hypothetical protein
VSRPRRTDLNVVPDLERELDELYGLPLGEFVAARNALAKRLEKAGQTREAERVRELAKPSISAWAVNQLARRDPERVRELLEAGANLVDAQKAALAGKAADRFDDASRRQRDAVRELLPAAVGVLEEAGHRPSDAVRQRIVASLRAASVDPEGRRLLEHGRLQVDFESAGLDLLAGFAPPQPKRSARTNEARLRNARERVQAARDEERRLADEAAEAEEEAERAAAAADEAAARARKLTAESARAKQAVEQATNELERLEAT